MRWLAALLLALLPLAAQAEERIRAFDSDVRIARDGTLTVVETIRIVSEGDQIKRGIQRDFPTTYRNALGQKTRVGFDVRSVTRDGAPEPYTMIGLSNGERVRIGRADVLLPPGDHSYVITYTTDRQLRFDTSFDELYWNATGTGWTFPIESASARITLPAPAKFGGRFMYTGVQGARGAGDAEVTDEGPGFIAFRTTRRLAAGEGLTVAADFPKGVVEAPSQATRAGWWLREWAPFLTGVAALLGLLFYQLRAWWVAGRGPAAGTVVPLFAPPEGMSAAACRYVWRMGMDNRSFTAAIVQSAVARQLHIDKQDGGWFARDTTVLSRTPGGDALGRAEQEMLDVLIPGDTGSIELKQANHSRLQSARSALGNVFEQDYDGTHFVKNTDWAMWGLLGIPLAMLAVAIVAALVGASAPTAGFFTPVGGLLATLGIFLFWRMTQGRAGCLLALAWIGVVGCAALAFFATFGSVVLAIEGGAWAVLLPLLSLPVALLAFKWMYAPTREGRVVMDEIAGFRHYLGITEEERLDTLHPPEKTPALFERYLPYAIALDVENRWADRFAGVLAAAAATAGGASALSWYSGSGNAWDDPGGFASSIGDTLNATVASASTSPSSSGSGSSGGGSSGGGGGGGGGSGW